LKANSITYETHWMGEENRKRQRKTQSRLSEEVGKKKRRFGIRESKRSARKKLGQGWRGETLKLVQSGTCARMGRIWKGEGVERMSDSPWKDATKKKKGSRTQMDVRFL